MKQSTAIADYYRQVAPAIVHRSVADTNQAPSLFRWRRNRIPIEIDEATSGPAGTPSRAFFSRRLDGEVQTARGTGSALACLVVRITGSDPDVTGLQPIHAAKLVADFAGFLKEICPEHGLICSQGAGAFAILAPRANTQDSAQLAHRLLWEIHDRAWRIGDCYVDLTCSIGVSHFAGPADRQLLERAIGAADHAARRGEPIAVA